MLDASSVRCIADMQRNLDAYGFVFTNLLGYLDGKFKYGKSPAIGCGIAASDEVNEQIRMLYEKVIDLRTKYDALRVESDDLRNDYDRLSHDYDSMRSMLDISVDLGSEDGDMSSFVIRDVFGNIVGDGFASAEDAVEYYDMLYKSGKDIIDFR